MSRNTLILALLCGLVSAVPAVAQSCGEGHYRNSAGRCIPSPQRPQPPNVARGLGGPTIPAGATARCRDGTYSFSQSRRGTCSGHGRVSEWL